MTKNSLIKIITHSGNFHADDVFAVATISLLYGNNFELVRTRDPNIIKDGDVVVDVGGEYDPDKKRFDHHQENGAGSRSNGIPYAAFGLVWKEYGKEICESKEIAEAIDEKIVQIIDAHDNGVNTCSPLISGVYNYDIGDYIAAFRPTWKEDLKEIDNIFIKKVYDAADLLRREIIQYRHYFEAVVHIESAYRQSIDKSIIIFNEDYVRAWQDTLVKYSEPLFAVYPSSHDNTWKAECVRKDARRFENRKNFPIEWAGKKAEEFIKISGVSDAVFCHKALFLAVAKSKEGALELARKALKNRI